MDPKQRNAQALHSMQISLSVARAANRRPDRINELMNELLNQYRAILAVAREDENPDYSESAQKELAIKEGAMAIVWFFHSLPARSGKEDALTRLT